MARRKYMTLRGGFRIPSVPRGVRIPVVPSDFSPSYTPKVKVGARSGGYTKKMQQKGKTDYNKIMRIARAMKISFDVAMAIYTAVTTKQPIAIPGLGALPLAPGTKTRPPQLTKNMLQGTMTKSFHKTGKPIVSTTWMKNGQKYIYTRTSPNTCLPIDSGVTNAQTLAGLHNFLINRVGVVGGVNGDGLLDKRSRLFAGTGNDQTPADTANISQRGSNYAGAMYLSNTRSILQIGSACNLHTRVRIYECVAKLDTSNEFLREPRSAWQHGIAETGGINDNNTWLFPGIYPGHSEAFRISWEVDGIYDVDLVPGSTHQHIAEYHYNYVLHNARFVDYGASHALAGITRAQLVVVMPSIVNNSGAGSNIVGFGQTGINIIQTETSEYYGKTQKLPAINAYYQTDAVTQADARTMADTSFQETPIR